MLFRSGAGLVLVVHIGVDDLPQRRGAVVESGLGGQPVVGDVLVDARDREVFVPRLIRLAPGLEEADELIADLKQAFAKL